MPVKRTRSSGRWGDVSDGAERDLALPHIAACIEGDLETCSMSSQRYRAIPRPRLDSTCYMAETRTDDGDLHDKMTDLIRARC